MEIEDDRYASLLSAINMQYGYDFSDYAPASVKRRIIHFIGSHAIPDIDSLQRQLIDNAPLFEQFVQALSVTVTEMFRDPLFYKSLRDNVIKHLATYPMLRIWIAGCATGEEAYSIAILLSEEGLLARSVIYATDINQRSLHIAKQGIYRIDGMKRYTENYVRAGGKRAFSDYYQAKYGHVMFDKSLGDKIVFSPHNLSADKSFNEFQLILCRNVLIYFNHALQTRVITLLYESLSRFGYIGLGDKESLLFSDKRDFFETVDSKQKIFRKVK